MNILSAAEMQLADERSAAAGMSLRQLMEGAGEVVAAFCLRQYPEAARVMVVCGKGNNGGDGLVAARLLAAEGVGVRVLLLGLKAEVRGVAAEALADLLLATSEDIVEELSEEWGLGNLTELLGEADLILDAVVGTGFRPPLRGQAVTVRDAIAQVGSPVVAVDLPSGWDADSSAERAEGAFRADAVVTFTAPKVAHVFGHLTGLAPNGDASGPVVVGEIGTPESAVETGMQMRWTGSSKSLTEKRRPIDSNKGRFGHVLVVGGSYGTAGAPGMAALACLRAGAGLVTAAVPRGLVALVGATAPEMMVRGLREGVEGSASAENLDSLGELLQGIKVVAVGPGLSTKGEAGAFARGLVAGCVLPMVIDADALNAFGGQTELLMGGARTLVLTPHPGEMARLLGATVKDVEADRATLARKFAVAHGVTLVLKGWRTLVAHPDGMVSVNTTGNPALAKGGSGDILTGIVAAMLAQYPDRVAQAVEAAVFLHGLAADLTARSMEEKTVLATDVLLHLSEAFRYRTRDQDGLEWLCGLRGRLERVQ